MQNDIVAADASGLPLPDNDIARHTNRISPTIFFPRNTQESCESPQPPGITQNCGDETKLYLVVSYKKQLAIMEIRVVHDARRPRLMLATLAFGDIGGAHSRKRG